MPSLLFYLIYDSILFLLGLFLPVISIFSSKVSTFCAMRSKSNRAVLPAKNGQARIWFHCASHGEFEQVKPVIERLKKQQPKLHIHVTFFSINGYQQGLKYTLVDSIDALPLDRKSAVSAYVEKVDADLVVWVRYDIFPHILRAFFAHGTPVYLFSASFRSGQFILSWWAQALRKVLNGFKHIYVVDEASQQTLAELAIPSIVAGDSRKQRVLDVAATPDTTDQWMRRLEGDRLNLVLGSVWPEDWAQFKEILPQLNSRFRFIIAPHELADAFIDQIRSDLAPFGVSRYTDGIPNSDGHLLLDTVGRLAIDYRYAQIAYVGGAFKQGLHNILEPLIYGIPVIFGPKYEGYPEAQAALQRGACISISDATGLMQELNRLEDVVLRAEMGTRGKQLITSMPEATSVLLAEIEGQLVPSDSAIE